jgi:glycine/D-amino acid oxidase-like deaminating enzyme
MNDQQIVAGLTALADSAEPPRVDLDEVIAQSKVLGRRRRMIGAAALGTTGVIAGVIAFTTMTGTSPPVDEAKGNGIPYRQLPPGPVAPPEVDASRLLSGFSNLLTAKVPVVVPGNVTQEQTTSSVWRWDITVNSTAVETDTGKLTGGLTVRVLGPTAAKVVRQQPPGRCVVVQTAPAPAPPVCYRQQDGSYVRVDIERGDQMLLPGALRSMKPGDPRAIMTPDPNDPSLQELARRPYLVAKHYRNDGSIVEVWGDVPVPGAQPTAFSDSQLVALATDRDFHFQGDHG